jgi:hypothetical protein
MSDRGVPFRVRDLQNVDISIQPDGTIVSNGRRTLGDDFPEGARDNPDRLVVPIPVDPENDQFPKGPNDTFPIISSTGIGGEGCRVVDGGNTDDNGNTDPGNTDSRDDVIPDTVSDELLPNTGGVPVLEVVVMGLFCAASGLLFFRSSARRHL